MFSGLRPGEKLFEELLADADATLPTRVPSLRVARLSDSLDGVRGLLAWAVRQPEGDAEATRRRLAEVMTEFQTTRS